MNPVQAIGITESTPGVSIPSRTPISAETLASISTHALVQSPIGVLEFKDGAPSQGNHHKVYDNLDLMHGQEAFLNAFRGVSLQAARKGISKR